MRPIQLEMLAFGPYKDKEIIDFEKLKEYNLFVISGPTGAGKTTIFDAICFALYGSASGTDRQSPAMMRSHFADDETHTSVQFIFQLQNKKYRIMRQLGHKKKGNKTVTGEKYEFYEIRGREEVPVVERQIVSEINKKIESIIGLTEDQFKQIVMLPQGEFRKLLTSETENKEAILRKLFKTDKYVQLQQILQNKRESLLENFKEEEYLLNNYMERIPSIVELREGSILADVFKQTYYNSKQIMNGLLNERKYLQEMYALDSKQTEKLKKDLEEKRTSYQKIVQMNEYIQNKQEKEKQLNTLLLSEDEMKNAEQLLHKSILASTIEPYEQQLIKTKEELEESQLYYEKLQVNKNNVQTEYKKAKNIYDREKERVKEVDNIKIEIDRLERFKPLVKALINHQLQVQQLEKEILEQENQINVHVDHIKNMEEKLSVDKNWLEKNDNIHQNIYAKQQILQNLSEDIKIAEQYKISLENYKNIQPIYDEQYMRYEQLKHEYEMLENEWINDQAVALASHLHEGDPCPVCGSKEHPEKAVGQMAMLSKEELDKKKNELMNQEDIVRNKERDRIQMETAYSIWEKRMQDANLSTNDVHILLKQLLEEKEKVEKELNQLQDVLEEIENRKSRVFELEKKMQETIEAKELTLNHLRQKQSAYETERSLLKEKQNMIPDSLQELTELNQHLHKLYATMKEMEENYKKIEQDVREKEAEQIKIEESILHRKQMMKEIDSKLKLQEKTYDEKLNEAKFVSEEEYKRSLLPSEKRKQLESKLQQYREIKTTLQHQIHELSKMIQDNTYVPVDDVEHELKKLQLQYENQLKVMEQKKYVLNQLEELQNEIKNVNKRIGDMEKELKVVSNLYDTLRGQNDKKISFERYLQIDYLEQITFAANERFRSLTNGQYYFIRSDRQETHGKQSGLAIDVYDAYTGMTRDVKTLSGGEKFIASLCLALGMSDIIQSNQGSISMDTMFIDEGFGSLDEESLQKAIDALIQLQRSGRMIGVISHVDELKEVFPAKIEVTKTKEGYSKTFIQTK